MYLTAAELPVREHDAPRGGRRCADALSNDYLNHFSEALMLIEIAADAPDVVDDLRDWRPIDYQDYFAQSQLRHAPQARAAYDFVEPGPREAFERVTRAMDQLIATAIRALRPPCEPEDAALVAGVTAPALRSLIAQASSFLNSGGRAVPCAGQAEEAQAVIDRLMAPRSAGQADISK
ncbi:MAG: hypothetical protein EA385_09015 [Salinarimonadaceae bacterium]|nr:MAG: hypothetical protein EA385_09015 [Salinarimonadaceae bacterium]